MKQILAVVLLVAVAEAGVLRAPTLSALPAAPILPAPRPAILAAHAPTYLAPARPAILSAPRPALLAAAPAPVALAAPTKLIATAPKVLAAPAPVIIEKPQPYSFGYEATDEYGTSLNRQETGDGSGAVTGTYGYTDAQGIYRQVDYIADALGFRASIRTNEPGTDNANPAGVQMYAEPIKVVAAPVALKAAPVALKAAPLALKAAPIAAAPTILKSY